MWWGAGGGGGMGASMRTEKNNPKGSLKSLLLAARLICPMHMFVKI